MRLLFIVLSLSVLLALAEGRRVRVRPAEEEQTAAPQSRAEYYAAQEEAEEEEQPQLIARQNYARAQQQLRPAPSHLPSPRTKSEPRPPPVQTIRNYNKLNDDGSFTFGYEAADGSFKEETRGTDCVVRGKYGYIDPDGNKREFTYVSGNPCDPNAVNQEDEELTSNAAAGEENVPENVPNRPIRPLKKKPATTLFQQNYNPAEEEPEENVPAAKPGFIRPFPQFNQIDEEIQPQILRGPRPRPTTASSQQPVRSSVRILRPTTPELPATTFRPQLVNSEPTQSPFFQTKTTAGASSPSTPAPGFEADLKKFQLDNNFVGGSRPLQSNKPLPGNPLYSTELVFDPATGQYQTVLFQQLPKASPFPAPAPAPAPGSLSFFPRSPSQAPPPFYQQQLFQQSHAQQVSQSTNLFNQQQQKAATAQRIPPALLDPSPQKFNPEPVSTVQRFPPEPKFAASQRLPAPANFGPPNNSNFVFFQPDQRPNVAQGQIDSFLRGHNLQF